jgi:hypothetical protein
MITKTYSITNTSDKHILVGNGSEMIASYDTNADAAADIDNQVPSIAESKWGAVRILAPGDNWTYLAAAYRPKTAAEKLAEEEEVGAWVGGN